MTEAGAMPSPAGPVARSDDARIALNLPAGVVVAAIAGVGLVLTARAGALALLVTVAVLQGLFAAAWVVGTELPGRRGALVIAALAAGGADVAVSRFPHGGLGTLLIVLGLSVPVMFAHQLTRGAGRTQLVSSLSGIAVLVVAVVALAALPQLRHEFGSPGLAGRVAAAAAGAAAAALVVGYLVDLVLPWPRFDAQVPRGLLALIVAAALGAAASYLLLRDDASFAHGRSVFLGAAIGALAGLLGVAASFVQHTTPSPAGRAAALRPVFAALLPIAAVAPVAYLLCLAIRL